MTLNSVTVKSNAIDNQQFTLELAHQNGKVVVTNSEAVGVGSGTRRIGGGSEDIVREERIVEGEGCLDSVVDVIYGGVGVVYVDEEAVFWSDRSTGGVVGCNFPRFHGFNRWSRTRRSRNRRNENWSRNRNLSRNRTGNRDWSRNWNRSRIRSRNRSESRIRNRNRNWNKRLCRWSRVTISGRMSEAMFSAGDNLVRTLGVRMARLMTLSTGGIGTVAENMTRLVAPPAGVDFTGIADVIIILFND